MKKLSRKARDVEARRAADPIAQAIGREDIDYTDPDQLPTAPRVSVQPVVVETESAKLATRHQDYDFNAAIHKLDALETERDRLMIMLAEAEDDKEYDRADKGIDKIHGQIKSLVIRYVQETHKVSRDEADKAMALLDEQDRKREEIDDWINDERPAVNV